MFAGLYLIAAGMFLTGALCYEVFEDQLQRLGSLFAFIGLLSLPLITIVYGIKLIINS